MSNALAKVGWLESELRRLDEIVNKAIRERDEARVQLAREIARAVEKSDDAEMIAQWIEGYGNEPMNSAIVAKAIRDGKWRAS